jgi:hypothetical protein
MTADNSGQEQARRHRRGGARANAGRPRKLTDEQRFSVGADCERMAHEMGKRLVVQATKDLFGSSYELRTAIPGFMSDQVPSVWSRQQLVASEQAERERLTRDLTPEALKRGPPKTLREGDIAVELHGLAGTDPDSEWLPIFRIEPVAPVGFKADICAAVAAIWSERIGGKLSASTVRDCWKEFLELGESIRAEMDGEP